MKKNCEVLISSRLKHMGSTTASVVKKRMTKITKDLYRVSTDLTPYKDGGLEQSGQYKTTSNKNSFVSTVQFGAKGDTYVYAKKMHDGKYNLGDGSLSKNRAGVKTIYSDKTFRVGKGFLKEPAKACQKGYKKYLESDIIKDLNRG